MSWGGSRVGAGRKPKLKAEKAASPFSVFTGGKTTPIEPIEPPKDLNEPPANLPEDQKQFWRDHAPLAIAKDTLIAETVPAFVLLCELHAKKVVVGKLVDEGQMGGLRVFLQLSKQVEGLMARFCLAPFGKPLKAPKPAATANPWAALTGGLKK